MEVSVKKFLISLLFIMNFEGIASFGLNMHSFQNCTESDLKNINNTANVAELIFKACDYIKLDNDIFLPYKRLSVLQITYGQLQIIGKSTFRGLKRLRNLSLAGNQINSSENWSVEPLIALTTLNLQRNKIKLLKNESFESYPNLQSLDISENSIKILYNKTFIKLNYLKYLDLAKNQLTHLPKTTFEGLKRLTYLNLSHNELSEISIESFESTLHLRFLMLDNNKLKNLIFLKCKSLERLIFLNLSHNVIAEIEPKSFEHSFELHTLDLSWNFLTKLNNESLKGLHSLELLNVSNNKLNFIESRAFEHIGVIKAIDLSYNNLSWISDSLFKTTLLLESINLAQNKLAFISEMLFFQLPYLYYINVSGNRLSNAAFTAHFATALRQGDVTLDLSNNLLQNTMLNITKLAEFKRVNLAGNHWSCLLLISYIKTSPPSLIFGDYYEMPSKNWSTNILHHNGFDCYDDQKKRNTRIIILQPSWSLPTHQNEIPRNSHRCLEPTELPQNPSPPPLVWPRIRMDKFDSRSVIIWMLIAIAIAFTGLRVARHLMDEKEGNQIFKKIKQHESNITEMETLHITDDNNRKA